ncbi:MAG: RNA polymerase sigma factor [Gemmatimonadales bacterium]|nr:RNA polymerase sigma factor [Gemmatimonadales bacterium]MYG49206.1 RNA polymerase sigma factor [Gemmatimonadales bacterium]MYK01952.1 RNA polymerase sigma factor [Candidatus Palauibacter ramosifaciens]
MLSDREILELVEGARQGERGARGRLAGALRPLVCRWALVMTGDPDDAEDVAQAVLMKTLSAIGSFDGRSRVTSWVYRITRNASLDHQREKRQEQRLAEKAEWLAESRAPELEDPLDDIEMKRTLRLIRTLVTELPMMQREVFDLVDLQGLRPGEAARLLEMNPNTLRVHLLRARRRMRKEMLARPVERGTEGKR